MDFKFDRSVVSGGTAGSGGGCYHLSFRSGSRAGGASGSAAYDYIGREREYDDPERDPAIYTESGHMPSWAEHDSGDYWDAADVYEHANGRLYVSADFALPRGLSDEDKITLAREFAHSLTDDERLPYSLAIHDGRDANGEEHNPHAHLMFSERRNDGIDRSPDTWFRRANGDDPEKGGAAKSRTFHGREWVEEARGRWEKLTNDALERAGRAERVDHRSYERQGIDREPGRHYGPSAAPMEGRGDGSDRLDQADGAAREDQALRALGREIAQLESARASLLRDGLPLHEREPEPRDYSHSHFSGGSPDRSVER